MNKENVNISKKENENNAFPSSFKNFKVNLQVLRNSLMNIRSSLFLIMRLLNYNEELNIGLMNWLLRASVLLEGARIIKNKNCLRWLCVQVLMNKQSNLEKKLNL